MAIGIYFANSKFTLEQYEKALTQLEAAGAGAPEGRTHHIALDSQGQGQNAAYPILDGTRAPRPKAGRIRSQCLRTVIAY